MEKKYKIYSQFSSSSSLSRLFSLHFFFLSFQVVAAEKADGGGD
jgi:hypothetical protein